MSYNYSFPPDVFILFGMMYSIEIQLFRKRTTLTCHQRSQGHLTVETSRPNVSPLTKQNPPAQHSLEDIVTRGDAVQALSIHTRNISQHVISAQRTEPSNVSITCRT